MKVMVIAAMLIVCLLAGCIVPPISPSVTPTPFENFGPDHQVENQALLETLVRTKVFEKLTTEKNAVVAWVGLEWYAAKFDEKMSVGVFLYRYYNPYGDRTFHAYFRDNYTGKNVAEYSSDGFRMY